MSRSHHEPLVSIIIPTRDRMDTLPRVTAALEPLVTDRAFEVVVVDDGSAGPTKDWLDRWSERVESTVIHPEHRGPAAARNCGVRVARAPWVAFLGDDTVPESGWAEQIRRCAAGDPRAGCDNAWVGHVRWHPRLRVTRFMDWIHQDGLQFGFGLIDDPDDLPFNLLYTSNLLIPRRLLELEPFDEGFPYAAYEDTELGYRLQNRGLRLRYLPTAVVAHDHPTTIARFTGRQWRAGFAAVHFRRLHPQMHWFVRLPAVGPPPPRSRAELALGTAVARVLEPFPIQLPQLWSKVLDGYFDCGARAALRQSWSAERA